MGSRGLLAGKSGSVVPAVCYAALPRRYRKHRKPTNKLNRLNREIKRRDREVDIRRAGRPRNTVAAHRNRDDRSRRIVTHDLQRFDISAGRARAVGRLDIGLATGPEGEGNGAQLAPATWAASPCRAAELSIS